MERTIYFSELWKAQREVLNKSQKDDIAIAYGKHVLNVDEEIMRQIGGSGYIEVDRALQEFLLQRPEVDYKHFWKKVEEIVPNSYSEKDIEFLSSDEAAPIYMINTMNEIFTQASPIMSQLSKLFWVNK